MWKNNEYKMCFKENTFHDFERIMLSSGDCGYMLPMVFIGEDQTQVAYYDCNGFIPLSSYTVDKTDDALFIMEKILLIMSNVAEYLISPAKVTLSTDTVFFNPETNQIKIAYVPQTDSRRNLRRNLLTLIAQLKADTDDGYSSYLDRLAGLIHGNNYHLRDLVNKLGLLRRELYSQTSAS